MSMKDLLPKQVKNQKGQKCIYFFLNPVAFMFFILVGSCLPVMADSPSNLPRELHAGELLYQNSMESADRVSDWVMEGPGEVSFKDGWMHMQSPDEEMHHVFWCPKRFPTSFIAQWDAQHMETDAGLCIVFFAAAGLNNQSIFSDDLPERNGNFQQYTRGRIRSYHTSYYANAAHNPDRQQTNLRKNPGFHLVQEGEEGIPTNSEDIHTITLAKEGSHIRLWVDDRKVIDWTDEGKVGGSPHGDGYIGLRQMQWTHFRYRNFRVWALADKEIHRSNRDELPMPGEGQCRKVTTGLDGAYHQYFAVPAWNADGSKLLVVRKQDGEKKAWVIEDHGDGIFAEPRELPISVFYFFMHWSATDPSLLYFTKTDRHAGKTEMFAFNVDQWGLANEGDPIISMKHGTEKNQFPQLYPPHPDGKHILLGPRQKGSGDICIYNLNNPRKPIFRIALNSLQHLHSGEEYDAGDRYYYFDKPGRAVHRIRFTHHEDLSMWMTEERKDSLDGQKRTWVVYPKDRTLALLDNKGGHFDFNPDGTRMAYISNLPTIKSATQTGLLFQYRQPDRSWKVEHVIVGMSGWTHLHWSPNPERNWIAADAKKVKGPSARWNNQLILIAPDEDYRITALCQIHSSFNSQATHGHPTFSFQADKIVFNSDYGNPRGEPDAYVMPIPKQIMP